MWRFGELTRDSFRNLGIPHILLFITLTAALTWASWETVSAADRAIVQEVHLRDAGANIWVAQAGQTGPLSAVPCINLAYAEGVVSAGGVYSGEDDSLTAYPGGSPLPVTRVTPGWAAVYAPGIAPGVTVGATLIDEYRIEPGGTLFDASDQAVTRVDVVAPSDAPTALLAAGVTIPAMLESTGLTECDVRMAAGNGEYGRDLLRATFGAAATVTAFDTHEEPLASPWQQWLLSEYPPPGLIGGLAIALVVLLIQWFRRGNVAIYRAFGSTRASVVTGGLLEAVLIAVPSVALSFVIMEGMLLTQFSRDSLVLRAGIGSILMATAAFIVAYGIATAIVATLSPARLLSDR